MNILSFLVTSDTGVHIDVAWGIIVLTVIVVVIFLYIRRNQICGDYSYLEVDEVEIGGTGPGKVKLKANIDDLQIGFKFWTELTTRKIGLPLDEEHDVIVEVYNSWYEFFKIARELIKEIPVSKVRNSETTRGLVRVTIHILNNELRPHLTRWQARYRKWWVAALANSDTDVSPQDLQKSYEHYKELVDDMKVVNEKLVAYAERLKEMLQI